MDQFIYAIGVIAIVLFVANVWMGFSGAMDQRRMTRERQQHEVDMAIQRAAQERLESLRGALKERYRERYSEVVRPVDLEASLAIGALLSSNSRRATRHLNAACDAARQLLELPAAA